MLVLHQLLLRLKESEVEALIKKQKETIKSAATWSIEASNCCQGRGDGLGAQSRGDAQ